MSRPGEGGDLVIYRRRSLAGPIVATNSEAQTRSIQNVLFINLGVRVPPGYMDRASSICRRTTGAPFVAWFSVHPGDFRIVKGEPMRFNSTEQGVRSFCSRCGTQLTFQHAELGDEIDVTTCSLDHPELVPPRDN